MASQPIIPSDQPSCRLITTPTSQWRKAVEWRLVEERAYGSDITDDGVMSCESMHAEQRWEMVRRRARDAGPGLRLVWRRAERRRSRIWIRRGRRMGRFSSLRSFSVPLSPAFCARWPSAPFLSAFHLHLRLLLCAPSIPLRPLFIQSHFYLFIYHFISFWARGGYGVSGLHTHEDARAYGRRTCAQEAAYAIVAGDTCVVGARRSDGRTPYLRVSGAQVVRVVYRVSPSRAFWRRGNSHARMVPPRALRDVRSEEGRTDSACARFRTQGGARDDPRGCGADGRVHESTRGAGRDSRRGDDAGMHGEVASSFGASSCGEAYDVLCARELAHVRGRFTPNLSGVRTATGAIVLPSMARTDVARQISPRTPRSGMSRGRVSARHDKIFRTGGSFGSDKIIAPPFSILGSPLAEPLNAKKLFSSTTAQHYPPGPAIYILQVRLLHGFSLCWAVGSAGGCYGVIIAHHGASAALRGSLGGQWGGITCFGSRTSGSVIRRERTQLSRKLDGLSTSLDSARISRCRHELISVSPRRAMARDFRHISQELTPKLWFKNISLTCHTLCRISRPFLFSELDWRPYTIIDDCYYEPILATDVIDRALERLAFCRSPRLLPSLTHLHVENCKLGDLECFTFKDDRAAPAPYHQGQWMRDTDPVWMEFFDSGHRLELDARPCEPVFGTDLTVIPSLPLVHKLAMTTSSFPGMSYYLDILAKFPGVAALYIGGETTMDDPAAQEIRASGPLPVISEYAGSYHLLDLFLPRSSVTRLTIDFYRDLRSISPLPSITVLDVIFSAFQTSSISRNSGTGASVNIDENGVGKQDSSVLIYDGSVARHRRDGGGGGNEEENKGESDEESERGSEEKNGESGESCEEGG
ncbi:hypothetical protein C8R44DRAFT_755075 [Mycena epipterygia]|nr:hypothetical protein C8R44DRAFT_755075 [Mycena epipterygia]